MKNTRFYALLALFLLLFTGAGASAQNNAYELDDSCYVLFRKAELSLGTPEFQEINEQLLTRALSIGDRKAETLYYVEKLKHLTRSAKGMHQTDDAYDQRVNAAHEQLLNISRRYGYPQYFYYSYELVETYYYNHGKIVHAQEMIQEMQETALSDHDDYGLWSAYRYLTILYIGLYDYNTAKKYIRAAIRVYENSTNEVLRRQSICRLYCDMADAFPIGHDSVRFFIDQAVKNQKESLDTLRCAYHIAKMDAFYKDMPGYRKNRDYCLASRSLPLISPSAADMFGVIDDIVERKMDEETVQRAKAIPRMREVKYIANIAEEYGYKNEAFDIEKYLVKRIENLLSETNTSRLAEMDAKMGNTLLKSNLAESSQRALRFSRWMMVLIIALLLGALASTLLHIRNLKRSNAKDELRIAELQEANEKVRLADAAKTRFVQNMSHEVRTPLNAIVGFSQLLSLPDGTFPEQEKEEFSAHIINNTKMLTMLLDDILNASAMDSGNYRITYEEGEVHYMAQAAISSAEHRLQPGVSMYYVPFGEEPFSFRTDPRRVQQILINLLTNACKHTAHGEIKLSSSLEEVPGYVCYAVTDTGTGIPPEQAEKIFERFTKLNEFVQGTGLGLSICRDIAGRMGAKVYLDTEYKEGGARFVFAVPIEPPES